MVSAVGYHRRMFVFPDFDPIAVQVGPLAIRWYGLMYLLAFGLFLGLGKQRAKAEPRWGIAPSQVDDLLFYGVLGVVLGGRLGYIVFYKPGEYLADPISVLYVWQGGMSFHGGLCGVLVATWLYARSIGMRWLQLTDFVAPLVPLGLAAGRMGNFINGELWGRPTDAPWGMVFPHVDHLARHPSQLYQFALEGVALYALLAWVSRKPRPCGLVSGMFLAGYALFRFLAEFAREPDAFLGTLGFGLTMGQWLSLPMAAVGIAMVAAAMRRPGSDPARP